MSYCAVVNCKNSNRNTKGGDVKFFRFPKNEELAKQWCFACCRKDKINLSNARVCSIHFDENALHIKCRILGHLASHRSRILKPDAVPTLNLPRGSEDKEQSIRISKGNSRQEVANFVTTGASTSKILKKWDNPLEGSINSKDLGQPQMDRKLEVTDAVIPRLPKGTGSETDKLKKELEELKQLNTKLGEEIQKKDFIIQKYNDAMKKVFSPGQIRKLLESGKFSHRIRWLPEDITRAISLHSVSPEAYKYLQNNNYPLPGLSTLRKWVSNTDTNPILVQEFPEESDD